MMSDNHDMIGLNIAHAYLYFLVGSQPADLKWGLHGRAARRARFDNSVFEVMFERVKGKFGCRARSSSGSTKVRFILTFVGGA